MWDDLPLIYRNAVEKFHYSGPNFQEAIRSGHMIIEALRPGVQINTLQHFLNIDDLDWNTEKTMGRFTISPDNVAQKLSNKNMEPVLLYINGAEKTKNIEKDFPLE